MPDCRLRRALVLAAVLGGFLVPTARAQLALITIEPAAKGTVRSFPEMGLLESMPGSGVIDSRYFRSTATNREFRRGFIEFSIPAVSPELATATLILAEERPTASGGVAADVHELASYPADLQVNREDYDRPATSLGRFFTDADQPPARFEIDVTDLVRKSAGGSLGFRVTLFGDPLFNTVGAMGSSFGDRTEATPRIEVRFSRPVAIDVRPLACPNRALLGGAGSLPVALLGSPDLDVTRVDAASARLLGVAARRSSLLDVGSPSAALPRDPTALDCQGLGPDGIPDLVLEFSEAEVAQAAAAASRPGEALVVALTAELTGEGGRSALQGTDVVVVIHSAGAAVLRPASSDGRVRGAGER